MKGHVITRYALQSSKLSRPIRLAILSDLHNAPFDDVEEEMAACDAILIPGDLVNRHNEGIQYTLALLERASAIRPTFFSLGNHDQTRGWQGELAMRAAKTHAVLLQNRSVVFGELLLGGTRLVPSAQLLRNMAASPLFSLLLCHQPEVYPKHIAGHGIDLTVSGHAHGGQISIFGRGLFSPGQGLFPRYTAGFYFDQHLLVSRGMTNSVPIPRIGVPCEMLSLTISPKI